MPRDRPLTEEERVRCIDRADAIAALARALDSIFDSLEAARKTIFAVDARVSELAKRVDALERKGK